MDSQCLNLISQHFTATCQTMVLTTCISPSHQCHLLPSQLPNQLQLVPAAGLVLLTLQHLQIIQVKAVHGGVVKMMVEPTQRKLKFQLIRLLFLTQVMVQPKSRLVNLTVPKVLTSLSNPPAMFQSTFHQLCTHLKMLELMAIIFIK